MFWREYDILPLLQYSRKEERGDEVSLSKAQAEANKKYHNKFDDIKVRVPKGERQVWQDHAATQNESLNGFIMRAVSETMERDTEKQE